MTNPIYTRGTTTERVKTARLTPGQLVLTLAEHPSGDPTRVRRQYSATWLAARAARQVRRAAARRTA